MSYLGRKLGCKIDNHDIADWGLIISKRTIPFPEVKDEELDIDGMDGTSDLSEVLNGDVAFKRIKITLILGPVNRNLFTNALNDGTMMSVLHGGQHKLIFDDDPFFYYIGRFKVKSFGRDDVLPTISVEVNAMPYKYDVVERQVDASICTENSFDFDNTELVETSADQINNLTTLMGKWRFVIRGQQPSRSRWRVPVDPDTFYVFSYRTLTGMTPGYAIITDIDGNALDPSGFTIGPHNAAGDFIFLNLYTQGYGSAVFVDITLIKAGRITLKNGRQRVFPIISASVACIALFNGKSIALPAGEYENFDIFLKPGDNMICFYGANTGTVTLKWRRGEIPYVPNNLR